MTLKTFCLAGIGLYIALSVADYTLTFMLINSSADGAFESNPVAAACLELHGWKGLALYKLGGVALFVASVALITQRQPIVAARLIGVGCSVLLGVAIYSIQLLDEIRINYQGESIWSRSTFSSNRDISIASKPIRYARGTRLPLK